MTSVTTHSTTLDGLKKACSRTIKKKYLQHGNCAIMTSAGGPEVHDIKAQKFNINKPFYCRFDGESESAKEPTKSNEYLSDTDNIPGSPQIIR